MATPEPHHGTRRTISIVDDVNLLSPQTRTSLPLPLGPLAASDIRGLEGEAESSCSHPREAMNLFLARRISRRNRTASLFVGGGGGGGGGEEESLFKADAVNEEDSERDRATQV